MFVDALTNALLHSIWQIALIAAALWIILYFVPSRNADTRYLISLAGLILVPLTFAGTLISGLSPSHTIAKAGNEFVNGLENGFGNIPFAMLWAVGVIVVLAKRVRDWQQIKQFARQPSQTFNTDMAMRFDRLRHALRISQNVRAGFSTCVSGPCMFGFFKPVILLPLNCLTHMSTLEIEAILAHELAHIKRADFLHKCFQSLVEALFFYHPGIKFISAHISKEREHACDDLAVSVLGQSAPLARGLLKSGLINHGNMIVLHGNSPNSNILLQRVRRLTGPQNRPRHMRGAVAALTLFVTLVIGGMSIALPPISPPFKTVPAIQMADLNQAEIVRMKDDICDRFKADGIYWDPRYGGQVAANVVFSENRVLMNGQPLPPSTHTAVRDILTRYGITQSTNGHLRFYGPEVSLTL